MTEDAAESRRPANTGGAGAHPPLPDAGPTAERPDDDPTSALPAGDDPTAALHTGAGDEPTAPFPPAAGPHPTIPLPPREAPGGGAGAADAPGQGAGGAGTDGPGAGGPPPGAAAPPPWGGEQPPPFAGSAFTSRYGLVRPRHGRYLAGVCAAIGRATNTDPILWRVLLAVLGFAGGIGIVIYLAAWLIIPNEGDTASPVESMLGRGRSSMSPILVIILSVLVAVMFGLIVTDKFRAIVLGAAILVGGALLLNRNTAGRQGAPAPGGQPPAWTPPAGPAPSAGMPGTPVDPYAGTAAGATYPPPPAPHFAGPRPAPPQAATSPAAPPPPFAASAYSVGPIAPPAGSPPPPAVPPMGPPPRGYRAPFAPHGPYAGRGAYPPGYPAPVQPPKPPKRPKERSPLGAATFSMIFVALGLVTMLDLANAVPVPPSAYFAAALVTIALGLLVGTWFGRARWLIALGLVTAAALGVSTVAESYSEVRGQVADVNWQPASYDDLADRYANRFGDAVLDLRSVDFTGRDRQVTAAVEFGTLQVILPPNVDVEALVDVKAGDARVFGTAWSGFQQPARTVTDQGADGRGGGKLRLTVHVNAGDVEVYR